MYLLFVSPAMNAYASEHIIIVYKRWVEARVSMQRLLGRTLQIIDLTYGLAVWA